MTGAVAGAFLGTRAIPEDVARVVTDEGVWGYEELVQLGVALHSLHERLREGRR